MELLYFDDESKKFCRGKLIYRQQGRSGDISVIDYGTQRVLSFDDAHEQSRIDLDQPSVLVHEYTRAMLLGAVFVDDVGHATVLGLGGGCLVRALHALFEETTIVAVELKQSVADVAQQYFALPDTSRFNLIVADAQYYLKQRLPSSTNIIFADMFQAYCISPFQMQEQFLRQSHHRLTDDGWLVINFHQLPELDSPFFACLNKLFDEVFICSIYNDNHIVYAGKRKLSGSMESFSEKVEMFQSRLNNRFDLLFKRIVRFRDYQKYAGTGYGV